VLEVLVTLGLGAASNAIYAALVTLIRNIVGREPEAERKQSADTRTRTSFARKAKE